jgi:hypothetical protein
VQVAICPTEEDSCLLRLVDGQSDRQRKSRSAVILSIIEHFEKGRRLGEIPIGFSVLLEADLGHAPELGSDASADKLLADVLLEEQGWGKGREARTNDWGRFEQAWRGTLENDKPSARVGCKAVGFPERLSGYRRRTAVAAVRSWDWQSAQRHSDNRSCENETDKESGG